MRRTTLFLLLAAASLLLAACGMMGGANVNVNVNANTNTAKPAEAAPANVNTNANSNANAAAKPADSGPKRISFAKGASSATESITLAAGQSRQFIIGGDVSQALFAESSSPDVKFLMITKKNATVDQEGATLSAGLAGKGDYIFEVRNPGTKEVKTSIKVQITDEGDD